MEPVIVVGAGVAGLACAREVAAAGLPVVVYDRGHRVGGRMARRTVDGRAVDIGASYLTARERAFTAQVADWQARGLARPWTDTFHLAGPDGVRGTTTGPVRWASPGGLRSLAEDLAHGLDVVHPHDVAAVGPGAGVDGRPASAVVLAMPDPQALDLLSEDLEEERKALDGQWEPVLALAAGWDRRCWPEIDGAFVADSAILTWVADDGRRRGDGAPVLVGHSGPVVAGLHLDEPQGAHDLLLREMSTVLGIAEPPRWSLVKRWSLAVPVVPRQEPYLLTDRLVGACGDGWHGRPRIEGAYLSGRGLGAALVDRLA